MPAAPAPQSTTLPLWLRRMRALRRKYFSRPPPSIRGAVDRVLANEVIGWSWDQAQPDSRLLVEALCGGVVLGRALADLPRRDLVAEGVGDGRHGFRIRLEKPIPSGGQLVLEAVKDRRRTRIPFGAKAYPFAGEMMPPIATPSSRAPVTQVRAKAPNVGFMDRVNGRHLEGWAVNPEASGVATVDLFDDEIYLGSVLANLERPRLQESGAPPGARGFSFDLTPVYNSGLLQRLRARVAGTTYDLRRGLQFPEVAEALEHTLRSPLAPKPAPVTDNGGRETLAAASPAVREPHLAVLLCGGDSLQALSRRGSEELERRAIADDAALTKLLTEADFILFASAEAKPAWDKLCDIESRYPDAAVFIEVIGDQGEITAREAGARAALRLAARGDAPSAFAVSGLALERLKDLNLATLLNEDWAATTRPLAELPRLRWCAAPRGDLIEPGVNPRALLIKASGPGVAAPTRVTLAVRDGWADAPPSTLLALMQACPAVHVDVLAPCRSVPSIMEASLRDYAAELTSLTYRQVDGFTAGEFWSGLRASAGQVLLIAIGDINISYTDVQRLCAWAMRPGVGFVSMNALDELVTDTNAPSFTEGLFALSRQALAELDMDLSGRLDGHEDEFESLLLRRGRLPLQLFPNGDTGERRRSGAE